MSDEVKSSTRTEVVAGSGVSDPLRGNQVENGGEDGGRKRKRGGSKGDGEGEENAPEDGEAGAGNEGGAGASSSSAKAGSSGSAAAGADADAPASKRQRVRKPVRVRPGWGGEKGTAATGMRAGGVYVPPFRLRQMKEAAKAKAAAEAAAAEGGDAMQVDAAAKAKASKWDASKQRFKWEKLRKRINGVVNKANVDNIGDVLPDLFDVNLVRGRGLVARSLLKAQAASPSFTRVYAAVVAVLNTKLPEVGQLILHRAVAQFQKAYARSNKLSCVALARFLAHLVNQRVCDEL